MHRQVKYYIKTIFSLLDVTVLNVLFFVTIFLCRITFLFTPIITYWLLLNSCWVILSLILGTYSDKVIMNFEAFTKRTVQVYILWMIVLLSYLFITREIAFSRLFILITTSSFSLGLLFNRFIYFGIRHYLKLKNKYINKVVILGYNNTAIKMASYFEEEGFNTQLLGFIEDKKNVRQLTNYPILAEIGNTIKIAKQLHIHEIYSTISPEENKQIYNLMNEAEKICIRFKIVPNLSVFIRKPIVIDYLRDLPVLSMRSDPMEDFANRIKKRFLDIIVSLLVIVFILSWMIPFFGLLILLESKGPLFFAQLRTGRNDKPFYCLKFRSMRMNKDSELKQATKNDSRVTRIGSFLRKTSLDEFPQFINVLKGDMSLVGPRPHMIKHTIDFSKIVDHYMVRQFLKPGITGWAQINSYRGEIKNPIQLKMRIASDLWYLENWNIWLDLRIIFLTIYHVFAKDNNAY